MVIQSHPIDPWFVVARLLGLRRKVQEKKYLEGLFLGKEDLLKWLVNILIQLLQWAVHGGALEKCFGWYRMLK